MNGYHQQKTVVTYFRNPSCDQSWTERLERHGMVVCKDCGHVAQNLIRHVEHVKEARHVNTFRFLAYRFVTIVLK